MLNPTIQQRIELADARMRYAKDSNGKWITLESGTHVQVDKDGNIIGGPAGLKEKGITSLKHFGGKSEKTESNPSTTVDNSKPPADTTPVASVGDAENKTGVEGGKMESIKMPELTWQEKAAMAHEEKLEAARKIRDENYQKHPKSPRPDKFGMFSRDDASRVVQCLLDAGVDGSQMRSVNPNPSNPDGERRISLEAANPRTGNWTSVAILDATPPGIKAAIKQLGITAKKQDAATRARRSAEKAVDSE